MAQTVKRLPAMQETQVGSLGLGDPLEKEKATHSSVLAWKIPWKEEPGRLYCPWGHKESDTTERPHFHSSVGKESACSAGDQGLIPGLGRSPAEGKGYPLQYSGLENSMDCIVHGVTKSRT